MKVVCRLTLSFEDVATARAVAEAVSLDDEGYIRTRRQGRTLTATASADGAMSLLHTLDDYLACVSAGERTAREARPRGRARRARGGKQSSRAGSS
jgi:hypothetical protein